MDEPDLPFTIVEKDVNRIKSNEILSRIHVHDKDTGGMFVFATGSQGSSKTSITLSFCNYILRHNKTEKSFWSNAYDSPLQFVKLPEKSWRILVLKDQNIVFRDRDDDLNEIKPPNMDYFTIGEKQGEKDYTNLFQKSKPGKVNATFFGNRFEWMDYIKWLCQQGKWSHVFIDEVSEVSPAFSSGALWKQIRDFSMTLKETRKTFTNIFCNTQSISDVDFRLRSKVMCWIYLSGSRTFKDSVVKQRFINTLQKSKKYGNEAWLEYSGTYGKIRFADIYKPVDGYHWDCHVIQT